MSLKQNPPKLPGSRVQSAIVSLSCLSPFLAPTLTPTPPATYNPPGRHSSWASAAACNSKQVEHQNAGREYMRVRAVNVLIKAAIVKSFYTVSALSGREPCKIIKHIIILIYCKLFPAILMSINGFNTMFIVFK